jgi:F-type H+-transporting ATPase subunit a
MIGMPEGGGGEGQSTHLPAASIFTPVYDWFCATFPAVAHWFGFDNHDRHLGQTWFEGLCFSIVACAILILLAFLGTRRLSRVPRGIQALLEIVVTGFRGMVGSMAGPLADRYVPFIGSTFLFIFVMNLLGILPAGRSPTMALSITFAMGLTAFVVVQFYCFRDAGPVSVLKHLAGPVWWMAPLIFCAELLSELVRPVSLSMRLFGNIYGEDNVIEAFMHLGGWIPLQLPILLLALLTSFLQAYIFTMLCTYYISSKVVHEEGHGEHGDEHGHEQHGHGH